VDFLSIRCGRAEKGGFFGWEKGTFQGTKRYFKGKGKVLSGVQKLFLIFIKLSLSLQMAITSGGYSRSKEITGP